MFYQFSRFRLFSFSGREGSSMDAMMSQGQIVKWNSRKEKNSGDLWLRTQFWLFSVNFPAFPRQFSVAFFTSARSRISPRIHAVEKFGKRSKPLFRHQIGDARKRVRGKRDKFFLLIDVLMFLSVTFIAQIKKQRKSQIMKLHSHVKRSLSAPSHHHSFPSPSPIIIKLPIRCCNNKLTRQHRKTKQKFSFVNFARHE